MHKRQLIVSIFLGLVVLGFLNYSIIGVAAQDFNELYELCKPTMTKPLILVASPQNNSIIKTNFTPLVFNVSSAQIIEMSPYITNTDAIGNNSRVGRVYFKGDWQNETQILYYNETDIDFVEFNITLSGIPDGTHRAEITADSMVDITVAQFGYTYSSSSNVTIIFYVDTIEPAESDLLSSIVPVIAVVALVIIVSLVVYVRNLKKNDSRT